MSTGEYIIYDCMVHLTSGDLSETVSSTCRNGIKACLSDE